MQQTAKQAFASRLTEALREAGMKSSRNAKSGVDVKPLATIAGVSREMARRYTEGSALPDANKLARIAEALDVRVAWLRDGEEPKHARHHKAEAPPPQPYLSDEAIEIAQIWMNLPHDRKECFRSLMALEAVVSKRYPWLVFGRPKSESYRMYEERIERDILRLTASLTLKK